MNVDVRRHEEWNAVYHERVGTLWFPAEDVVRFCARHIRTRIGPVEYIERRKCERILDLGCGNGRHVVYFARQGFEVSGIDISSEALALCAEWLQIERLVADLRCASVDKLPYSSDEFDAIVSFGVLDHVTMQVGLRAMNEIVRVLKRGGLLHLNLRSPDSYDFGKGQEIEPGTYVLAEGHERGLPQHFWTEPEMQTILSGFTILNWELHVQWPDRTIKDSRWAVSAQLDKR